MKDTGLVYVQKELRMALGKWNLLFMILNCVKTIIAEKGMWKGISEYIGW